jgi:hypothetical protein
LSSSLIALCPSCPTPDEDGGHRCRVYPSSSVTDTQWAILESLLPPPGNLTGRGGRPDKHCRRLVMRLSEGGSGALSVKTTARR